MQPLGIFGVAFSALVMLMKALPIFEVISEIVQVFMALAWHTPSLYMSSLQRSFQFCIFVLVLVDSNNFFRLKSEWYGDSPTSQTKNVVGQI